MTHVKIFYATAPDTAIASQIAKKLVSEKLAACVNILPGMTSVYSWQDKIESSPEVAMIIKSTEARSNALVARFNTLHPYETPAIAALSVDAVASSHDFLDWIASVTGARTV